MIEVLSPSNTVEEMLDKERTCLEGGCREFWLVDEKRRQVKVSTPDGVTRTYHEGQETPLNAVRGRIAESSRDFHGMMRRTIMRA